MSRLLLATRSLGKRREFAALLAPYGVDVALPEEIGLVASAEEEGLECWPTFLENARAKAAWFAERSGLPTLADDSGLEVDALDGAPGVHSKRFAGRDGPDHEVGAANNAALLAALTGVPAERRTARYRCVLVLRRPDGAELVAEGAVEGRILDVAEGDGGFGYDPLFWSPELAAAFGAVSKERKAEVSHRARAVRALIDQGPGGGREARHEPSTTEWRDGEE